ncbi:MAG: ABC transporter permease [Methylococcales bacterium]|nr:ABC transporter permease [Methylococcales bacterium]
MGWALVSVSSDLPVLQYQPRDGRQVVVLGGVWTSQYLRQVQALLVRQRHRLTEVSVWDFDQVRQLDRVAAGLLWQVMGERSEPDIKAQAEHRQLFQEWQDAEPVVNPVSPFSWMLMCAAWWHVLASFWAHVEHGLVLLGSLCLDGWQVMKRPARLPVAEIVSVLYQAGVRALGITALVGFLIGIVLSYLSSLQLQMFGAEIYIIKILGMSVIRELGPLLAAILIAGRSGSAMTAQIGIMRVTEELDALSAMGISHSLRLVLPNVVALLLAMPLLTVWTDAAALLGGILAAWHTLDISPGQFLLTLPNSVPLLNVFLGFAKAAVFGVAIALIACHFGFRIQPNTESLGQETTNSVVAAITMVILVDAVFAIAFMNRGMM